LNALTIQDYFNNKALFDELGRDTSINVIIKEIRGKALEYETEKLVATRMDFAAAAKQAKDWLKTQAVLHNPDQVVGGNSKNVSVLGNKNINSSIGSQWRWNRADSLFKQIYEQSPEYTKRELG